MTETKTPIYAVVTGDIKNFTFLDNENREQLIADTEALLKTMVKQDKNAQIFRGDSYQFILDDLHQVLTNCIQLICWFKLNSEKNSPKSRTKFGTGLGTRLSIGIGPIAYQGKTVLDSDGEAFHLSGRSFDEMDKTEIIRLTTDDEEKNKTYQVILMYINLIAKQWTISQAETIYHLLTLEQGTQGQIAEKLNMSQPAVANSLRSSKWKEVEKGINFITRELEKQYFT